MNFHEYLKSRAQGSRDNGVLHLPLVLEKLILDNGTECDLESLIQGGKEKQSGCERFSLNYCYWWSLTDMLEDVKLHWDKMKE